MGAICNSQVSMQVIFSHDGTKKDGTLMVGQSIFGDLYNTIDEVKANIGAKYNIPVEHIDISFGPTHTKWTGSDTLSATQVTVHRGVFVAFKGGDAEKYWQNADTYRFKAE